MWGLLLVSSNSMVDAFMVVRKNDMHSLRRQPTIATNHGDTMNPFQLSPTALGMSRNEEVPSSSGDDKTTLTNQTKKYVVVGGGWGGWGAAKALCESSAEDMEVILMDTLPDPTGRTPYLSKSGKPVEAGTRGFWKDYPNIYNLCRELPAIRSEESIFTEYTNSSFYSPDGLEATAPVFSYATAASSGLPFFSSSADASALPSFLVSQLPSPLGQVIATLPLFERIPIVDRVSMIGLLLATVDCLGSDDHTQAQYDKMTASELFLRFGLSKRLVDDFITPTLLVGLFKPPEELSALVVMELLYYYALAHVDSFDVRWIKNGTVSSSLIAPLATYLETKYNLTILGGCRVGKITCEPIMKGSSEYTMTNNNNKLIQATSLDYYDTKTGVTKTIDQIDGIVLALTCKGMQSVVSASPELARIPVFSKAASCSGIDVISVRIWLDQIVPTRTPANVFSRFPELRGAGGTFFMLDQFQQDNLEELWGQDTPQGSVVACDFYNAGALLSLPEEDLLSILMNDLLPSAVPAFADAKVVDSWVGKYPGAVTWFAPGSYGKRPPLEGAGTAILPNIKCAGDWVKMGDKEHGAKGLCQERAYVSGLQAANSLLESTMTMKYNKNGATTSKTIEPKLHVVLPVREDEVQFRAAVALNQQVMKFVPRFWVR